MKAARWYARGDVRVEDVPEPTTGTRQVKVKVKWCGICGTDLHEYTAGPIFIPDKEPHPLTGQQAPVVLGHELSGDVVEVGKDVTRIKVGDRVCIEPMYPCGTCRACRAGKYNLCSSLAFHGIAAPGGGGFAEFTVVDEYMVYKLPPQVTYEQGAIVEPMAMVLHAIRQSSFREADSVAVFGAGPIGLLIVQATKAAGTSSIIVVEPSDERRLFAKKTGATHTLNPVDIDVVDKIRRLTNGGVEVAFEATGVPVALNSAINCVIFDGQIMVVSVWEGKATIFPNDVVMQEKTIKGILGNRNTFPLAIDLIAQGKLPVEQLITKKIKLDHIVDEGLDTLVHEKSHVKILVEP